MKQTTGILEIYAYVISWADYTGEAMHDTGVETYDAAQRLCRGVTRCGGQVTDIRTNCTEY